MYHDPGIIEYPGYNGWYNNIGQPKIGTVDAPLLRRQLGGYKDGIYKPSGFNRPNTLKISKDLLNGEIGFESVRKRNVLQFFFYM